MFAVIVTAQIKPEFKSAFIEAMLDDAQNSVALEDGCLLFNIVENQEDLNRIHLYEVYTDAEAFEVHKQMPHFQRWLEATAPWLAEPLAIATGNHVFPDDTVWQKQK